MTRTFLILIAAALVISPLLADDKKDEKIDPAKLVGEWKAKEKGRSPLSLVGIEAQFVFEYEKGGGVKLKLAQPDNLAGGLVHSAGTYKVTGSTLERTVAEVDEKGKPREGLKPSTASMEIVKLTDTELHLKDGKEVTVWLRLTADDKDTTVDTAKLVGRWKSTVAASDGMEEVVIVHEYTKDGKWISYFAPPNDLSKVKQKEEGTYKLKDGKLEVTGKLLGDKTETMVCELVRLTDAKLVYRTNLTVPGLNDENLAAFQKWLVIGYERVKEEKKEK